MPLEEKRNVVANLRSMEGSEEPPPKVCVEEDGLEKQDRCLLRHEYTEKSWSAGHRQRVPRRRSCHVGDEPMYQAGARRVRGLLVTNDAPERGSLLCRISLRTLARGRRTSCNASFKFEDHRKCIDGQEVWALRDMKISSNQYNFSVTLFLL
ncbi:hypothetical protein GWK47_052368 [Chionoecetes opilio]|uniref:Uncharacterized protein n=1 Tax=Chionoecetes opilio TaxID=41210 RepID=A0A8J5CRG8_CHIOP|nr:hypothetical protein GWK47_052368 [Chionoecetes opilio]